MGKWIAACKVLEEKQRGKPKESNITERVKQALRMS